MYILFFEKNQKFLTKIKIDANDFIFHLFII